jgi:hypothetical protein
MKKLVIGLLVVLAGIAAVGLATVPGMTHTVFAQTGGAAGAGAGSGGAAAAAENDASGQSAAGAGGSSFGECAASPSSSPTESICLGSS